jgi:Cu/Ag efflux pump CusA
MKNTAALILIFCLIGGNLFAQKASRNKQIKLEEQRIKLREEIKQINSLLFENKNQKKSTLSEVEDIQLRISVRKQLIRVNNEQANFLDNLININQRDIDKYRLELKKLKEEYALMIQNSYKSKSMQNRLMFVFSSENLLQAYKRLDYLKQYNAFRKK